MFDPGALERMSAADVHESQRQWSAWQEYALYHLRLLRSWSQAPQLRGRSDAFLWSVLFFWWSSREYLP